MPAKTTRRTVARQWELLKLLPTFGSGKSASELTKEINEVGFSVSKRQVERDLQELGEAFALECNEKSVPYGWKWPRNASVDIPGLTLAEALSLRMVKDTVHALLPEAMLQALESRFALAEKKLANLAGDSAMANWPNMVRSVSPTMPMLAPQVAPEILTTVQDSLLAAERVEVHYMRMEGDTSQAMSLHPLALVNRGLVTYLVATAWEYTDVRLYALHRITHAKRIYETCQRPLDFELDKYIAEGGLQFGSGLPICLKARLSDNLGRVLRETPLSTDQDIKGNTLSATVLDTWQLNWWLLGQGDAIKVLGPRKLRERIRDSLVQALAAYED